MGVRKIVSCATGIRYGQLDATNALKHLIDQSEKRILLID